MECQNQGQMTRRRFLLGSALTGGGLITADFLSKPGLAQVSAPAIIISDNMRPSIPYGVASGDMTSSSAVIWSRSDRPARMIVEYDTTESFRSVQRIVGSAAIEDSDYTARLHLRDLPANQQIFYRVTFEDLASTNVYSAPVTGSFRTAPSKKRNILFAWSGDTAGQGWGINREFGGMKIYETMRRMALT